MADLALINKIKNNADNGTENVLTMNFQSETAVRSAANKSGLNSSSKARHIAKERLLFTKEVFNLIQKGYTQADAVNAVASNTDQFPNLVKAGKKGKSALTVFNYRKWIAKIKVDGEPDFSLIDNLADKYGTVLKGAQGDPRFWTTFNALYLNENRLSLKEAYSRAVKISEAQCLPSIPTERQTRYYIDNYADKAAVLAARNGKVFAENHIMSYIRRDWSAVQPNECWIGDHHVFDVFVKSFDEEKQKWVAVRPWFTAWLDAKSLAFVGIYIGADSPSSTQILFALQNAIRLNDNTAPKILYNDNGKDYKKTGFTELFKTDKGSHSIANELGIKTINSLPYRARAKTIERMFGEVCTKFSKYFAAYLGSTPSARPEVSSFFHKNPEHLPTIQQFCEAFNIWLKEYHRKPIKGTITNGLSPAQIWKKGAGGIKLDDEQLWFAMLLPYTKNCPKVARGAAVTVNGIEYRSDALWDFFGQKIMVKLDITNGHNPQAFTLDGKYICNLEPITPISALATSKEDKKLISEQLKIQRQELKRAFAIADDMTNEMHKISPQNLMIINPKFLEKPEIKTFKSKNKSVKGNNHNYELTIPAENNDNNDDNLTKTQLSNKKITEFDDFLNSEFDANNTVSSDEISDIHNHIINNTRSNDNDELELEQWDIPF